MGVEDEGTCAYLGVPYAEPPQGELRWRPPAGVHRSELVRADTQGSSCVQVDFAGVVTGSEDCLTLNLWRPASGASLLPVLVFFHGGGNVTGSAVDPRYRGARLAKALGAVVVTVEFRLGALGYLVHPALSAESPRRTSGNYALLDQIEALDWVRHNAFAFGGDASRVTVLGQSAGARNICALLASPNLAYLFRAAILHSGACNAREYNESEQYGIRVSQALGCELDPHPALCMRRKSAAEATTAFPSLPDPMTISAYNPTVDGWLLSAQPLAALTDQRSVTRPVVVGSNADETAPVTPKIDSEAEYRTLLRAQFGEALVERVLAAYPSSAFGGPTEAAVAAVSEARYTCAARQTVRALDSGGQRPYRFWFSHRPENPPYDRFGATHGLELMYLFGTYEAYGYEATVGDRRIAGEWLSFYANFVHDAEPGTVGGRNWLSDTEAPGYVLRLGAARPLVEATIDERCDFWDSLAEEVSSQP